MFSLKGSSQGELKIKTHQDHVAQVAWVGNKELSVDNYSYNKIDKSSCLLLRGYQLLPRLPVGHSIDLDLSFKAGQETSVREGASAERHNTPLATTQQRVCLSPYIA